MDGADYGWELDLRAAAEGVSAPILPGQLGSIMVNPLEGWRIHAQVARERWCAVVRRARRCGVYGTEWWCAGYRGFCAACGDGVIRNGIRNVCERRASEVGLGEVYAGPSHGTVA